VFSFDFLAFIRGMMCAFLAFTRGFVFCFYKEAQKKKTTFSVLVFCQFRCWL